MLLRFARSTLADLVASLPFLAAALMAAGVVHIAATLALGQIGTAPPFARLQSALPTNAPKVLEPVDATRQPLAFMMPHMAYAVCRFDVRAGPILVKSVLEAEGWSLSMHGRSGDNFHLVAGVAQQLTPVELILVPPGNRFYAHSPALLFANEQVPEIKPSEPEGLIVLRAPVRSSAHRAEVTRRLAAMTCGPLVEAPRAPIAAQGGGPNRR